MVIDTVLYSVGELLGKGSYGSVHAGRVKATGEEVALKFIDKAQALKKPSHYERLRREVRILRLLKNQSPHVLSLEAVHETATHLVIVTELLKGGELLSPIKQGAMKDETIAKKYFSQLVAAVAVLHGHGVIHRDIKPQNIIVSPQHLKLVDFGFATIWDSSRLQKTFCGSPYYASPEMVMGIPYLGPEVDVWSLGVILYSMIAGGKLPFIDTTLKGLYGRIASGHFEPIDGISAPLLDLLSQMLKPDSTKRISIADIQVHPWLTGFTPVYELPKMFPITFPLSPSILVHVALLLQPLGEDGTCVSNHRPTATTLTSLAHFIELRSGSRASLLYQILWQRECFSGSSLRKIHLIEPGNGTASPRKRSSSTILKFLAQRFGVSSFSKQVVPLEPENTLKEKKSFILLPEEIDPLGPARSPFSILLPQVSSVSSPSPVVSGK